MYTHILLYVRCLYVIAIGLFKNGRSPLLGNAQTKTTTTAIRWCDFCAT